MSRYRNGGFLSSLIGVAYEEPGDVIHDEADAIAGEDENDERRSGDEVKSADGVGEPEAETAQRPQVRAAGEAVASRDVPDYDNPSHHIGTIVPTAERGSERDDHGTRSAEKTDAPDTTSDLPTLRTATTDESSRPADIEATGEIVNPADQLPTRYGIGIIGGLLGFVEEDEEDDTEVSPADESADEETGAEPSTETIDEETGAEPSTETIDEETGAEPSTETIDEETTAEPSTETADAVHGHEQAQEATAKPTGAAEGLEISLIRPGAQASSPPPVEQPAPIPSPSPDPTPAAPQPPPTTSDKEEATAAPETTSGSGRPPGETADAITGPAQPAPDPDLLENLTSFDVGRRRSALRTLLSQPLDPATAAAVAEAVQDPDVDVRHLALQVLERAPELVPTEALRSIAFDIDASVRARALMLIGRTARRDAIGEASHRIVSESDQSVLDAGLTALASLVRTVDLDDEAVDEICLTVGSIPMSHLASLDRQLRTLASALPVGDIVHRLGSSDARTRSGAAALALESGDDEGIRALARLTGDPDPGVRRSSSPASARLRRASTTRARPDEATVSDPVLPPPPPNIEVVGRAVEDEVEDALLPGMLQALTDPNDDVRAQARTVLQALPRERVVSWITEEAKSAPIDVLIRLVTAARLVEAEEAAEPLAHATLRIAHSTSATPLVEALRQFEPIRGVISSWRESHDPSERADALRLSALIEPTADDVILEGLGDSNADVRLAAIEAATGTQITDRIATALAELIEADSASIVRLSALGAFRWSPQRERISAAQLAATSPYPEVRQGGLELLTGETDEEFALLAAALRDESADVVHRAAAMLRQFHPPSLAVLWWQLRGTSGESRQLLIQELYALDGEAVRRLAAHATTSDDPTERIIGISTLAALGDRTELARLTAGLDDPSVDVRLEALRALSGHPGALDIDPVVRALKDPEPQVRAVAVTVLAGLDDEQALPHLIDALGDRAEGVRQAACEALYDRRSPGVVDLLLAELDRPAKRALVAELLARMGEQAAMKMLSRVPTASPELQQDLLDALRRSPLSDRLTRALEDRRPAKRRAALQVLGVLRKPETLDAIIGRLSDSDPQIRASAATHLGDFGDRRAVPALRETFSSDPDMDVVAAAEQAYRKLTSDA